MKTRALDLMINNKDVSIVVTITQEGKRWKAYDSNGNEWSSYISTPHRQRALNEGNALSRKFFKDGRPYWRVVPMSEFSATKSVPISATKTSYVPVSVSDVSFSSSGSPIGMNLSQAEFIEFMNNAISLKPKKLFMSELKWKHLVRTTIRGKNVMITGMHGSGKTLAAKTIAHALNRPFEVFNLGATQDPKGYLVGNTHYNKDEGTFFCESRFVRAIQTPNTIIVLDELSRASFEAWNILMSVLDEGQRYLVLDEDKEQRIVKVASGVTFIATANIGQQYTATRVLDSALIDRQSIIEMDILSKEEETKLLQYLYPSVNKTVLSAIADISSTTRKEINSPTAKISEAISTRTSVEIASLIYDGFSLAEAAELCIYPIFPPEGGLDSARTYVKQLVQKHVGGSTTSQMPENLFTAEDINQVS